METKEFYIVQASYMKGLWDDERKYNNDTIEFTSIPAAEAYIVKCRWAESIPPQRRICKVTITVTPI